MKVEFDLEEWLLEFEIEEDKADMHYSTYFTPEKEEAYNEAN